ncbi:MAG: NADP-dependent oxidoreductase, partial [Pseudomonadota bacterium]
MRAVDVILARRPVGVPRPEHFELREAEVPEPADGQLLIRATHWSVEPAMRGWTNAAANYSPPVPIGAPMRAFAVGDVIASRHPDFAEGDVVEGLFGWRSVAVADGASARKVTETDLPRSYALGVLGLNGTTAYFGLLDCCAAEAGDVLVVSTAAGAVGSAVG